VIHRVFEPEIRARLGTANPPLRRGEHRLHIVQQLAPHLYLTQSVFNVGLQQPIPTQIRQLILHISDSEGSVDGFVGELASAQRL
jgi:hypothetical protein